MRQEIIKIHREALQYIDEYTEGEITNKTVKVYMDSKVSDLPVRSKYRGLLTY